MFSFIFPKKCSLSGRIGSHNHIAEIYSVSANAILCVFASVVLYSSVEIATFGVTYVYDGPVFVGQLICTRLSGNTLYSFRVAKSLPNICYRHNTLLHILRFEFNPSWIVCQCNKGTFVIKMKTSYLIFINSCYTKPKDIQ